MLRRDSKTKNTVPCARFRCQFQCQSNRRFQKYKGLKGGVMADARKLGARRFEDLKENTEVFYSTALANYDYSVFKNEPLVVSHSGIAHDEEEWKQKAHEHLQATSAKRLG